jgi:hypothetical protein
MSLYNINIICYDTLLMNKYIIILDIMENILKLVFDFDHPSTTSLHPYIIHPNIIITILYLIHSLSNLIFFPILYSIYHISSIITIYILYSLSIIYYSNYVYLSTLFLNIYYLYLSISKKMLENGF